MSTARGESPGGKKSPLDRLEEERKRRAEIAADTTDFCPDPVLYIQVKIICTIHE
jgi:hypothetical protein